MLPFVKLCLPKTQPQNAEGPVMSETKQAKIGCRRRIRGFLAKDTLGFCRGASSSGSCALPTVLVLILFPGPPQVLFEELDHHVIGLF